MSLTSEFQNLQEKLRPLNLYALSGDTTVDAELKAYAAGININSGWHKSWYRSTKPQRYVKLSVKYNRK